MADLQTSNFSSDYHAPRTVNDVTECNEQRFGNRAKANRSGAARHR